MRRITALVLAICLLAFSSCSAKVNENFIKPKQKEYTAEEYEIIEEAYKKVKAERPEFAKYPRDMFYVNYFVISGVVEVNFTFCVGGVSTEMRYKFIKRASYSDGEVKHEESAFDGRYNIGLTQEQLDGYKADLASQIQRSIDNDKLEQSEDLINSLHLYWEEKDDGIYLCTEYIANVTEETTETFGCMNHAHLFGSVKVFE